MDIYLRPLKINDALISYKWRNNKNIWKYTGKKPNKVITKEIEKAWLEKELRKSTNVRYAICIKDNNQYIGNVQLTEIHEKKAEFHIFIGEEKYWGKGIGLLATKMLLDIAFHKYKLNEIYLTVDKENIAAIKLYKKCGFKINKEKNNKYLMYVRNKYI